MHQHNIVIAEFGAVDNEFLENFMEHGQLRPDGRVLDVGCGLGRMALPMTGYSSLTGSPHATEAVQIL